MADESQDFRRFVLGFINSEFVHIKSLHNVESILRKAEEDKKVLEDQACCGNSHLSHLLVSDPDLGAKKVRHSCCKLSTVSSEVPKKIEGAVQDARDSVYHIKDITKEQTQISHDITSHLTQTQPIKKDLSQFTTQVEEVERYVQYLRWLTFFEEMSEFEEVVKQLGWPFLGVSTHVPLRVPRPTHQELTFRLETLFDQLLKIQLPDTMIGRRRRSSQTSVVSDEGDRPLLLPLQLLLKPLRKRFKFHFTGSKQTNALDKPEWYLTQILGWIRDHADFLDHNIQPLLNKAGYPHVEAKVEFTRGLLTLVADKLAQDMDSLVYDEHLFSHTIDEVLLFDRELRGLYSYPASQPGVLHVLTVQDTFNRWITVERKFAVEKMDLLFSSETAWTSQYGEIEDVDDMKTGECAEGFMTLMLALTDRYKPLPSAANKLQFLDLQLELLDDFRIRLTQVMKSEAQDPLGSTFLSILNAVNYVISVLREWADTVFFLQLQYYRAERYSASRDLSLPQEPDLSSLQGAVFDELITLFQLLRSDMLSVVCNLVFTEMKARSKDYKDEKWLGLPSDKEYISRAVSASACPLLLLLKDRLHQLQLQLANPLFSRVWQTLADIINTFIMEEIILTNHFNEGGAAQLQFDMTRNLFPLFGEYTPRPDNYFKDVKEACLLLNLKPGSAMLLKEMLNKALNGSKIDPNTEKESPEKVLMDMGVFKLSIQEAERVLNLRANWPARKKGRS
ncbi:RAD50-interacting protein 1-like isoform X4 [Branchiostoma lanceolatum]|uniref:RAD50-interacting protein 1-like isoform X4 n=1 Tax=Branchiostoma lanceolatum TaxID=7740 RepID=UPI00345268B3